MRIYNIHDVKTQLSRLGEQAAKAGKPMAKVVALRASEPSQIKRFGFMAGQIHVPDDFDRMDETEIARLFEEGV